MPEKRKPLRCKVGWHRWVQNRPSHIFDGFPPVGFPPLTRECACGARQKWLPGYGGSEWGCWTTEART